MTAHEKQEIYNLIHDLSDPVTREGTLLELSTKRDQFDGLAVALWYSAGNIPLYRVYLWVRPSSTVTFRYHVYSSRGDYLFIPPTFT